ncbi:ABC-type multidrug transport system ATPase and permease component-like protein [Rhizobium freirei PRF 81]|uniref:ABC-type multidrug transport system ATPase and permease component-like protein n=1 Tax=Rhizobium freirei PRF 81 TaxID=363754 RepID=N6UWZ2_9HYPH|nr:ABC transporter ATP-binding protein [Rhizobium freirei]ENN85271.1 ABC-type multidrug transport system ATPase and permease component-like protein [Rhizobium freirei PRF 81]
MPSSLFGFILMMGRRNQVALAAISVLLFVIEAAPLELQRRIVNAATTGAAYHDIVWLALGYLGLVTAEGLIKLGLNVYRSWVGEVAIRWLRNWTIASSGCSDGSSMEVVAENIQLSIVLAEAEPVGGFVGTSISEPLLQIGILVAVGGYLVFLQPLMALVIAVVYCPQVGFVPIMQAAINRWVGSKVNVMRDISEGMIEHLGPTDVETAQTDRVHALFSINMSIYKLKYAMNFLMNLMIQLGYVGIFVLGGYYVVTGKTEIGTVVAFVSGLSKLTDPWGALVDWYRDLKATQVKYALIRDASKATSPVGQIDLENSDTQSMPAI